MHGRSPYKFIESSCYSLLLLLYSKYCLMNIGILDFLNLLSIHEAFMKEVVMSNLRANHSFEINELVNQVRKIGLNN